jgi:beta-mannosidase
VQSTVADECPLHISTRQFAQYVHIDVDGFDVSDQYFHLSPGAAKTVLLRRRPHTPKRDLRGSVRALNSSEIAGIIVE